MSKKILPPYNIAPSQSLTSSFQTPPTNIQNLDRVAISIDVISGSAVGTVTIQGRVSLSTTGNPFNQGPAQEWSTLAGTSTALVASGNSTVFDITTTGLSEIRLAYVSTSGTGTASIWIAGKESS